MFVTSRHEVGAAYGFITPVTQTSGAQLVIARPLPDEGTLSRSRDGNRALFVYFGPDEQDPRQDLMVGSDPAVFNEPWTLPSG